MLGARLKKADGDFFSVCVPWYIHLDGVENILSALINHVQCPESLVAMLLAMSLGSAKP